MADEPPVNGTSSGSIPVPTRKERRHDAVAARRDGRRHGRRTWGYLLGGAATVVVAVGAAALATAHHQDARAAATTTTTTTKSAATPTTFCPLRGTPAPGGVVPARPALAIKIGNYTGDRPSAGLNQADIVFEEPVEGAITRLVAVFQCQSAPLVGDLRSAREPDVGILSQLSDPIFVHAGGIAPILSLLADAPLTDENILEGGTDSAIVSPPPNRVAPYSTFTSTAAAWALDSTDNTPPAPIFVLRPRVAGRLDRRVGRIRPHPVLVDFRRHLDSGTRRRACTSARTRACPTPSSAAARRRPPTWSSCRFRPHRPLGREQRGRPARSR